MVGVLLTLRLVSANAAASLRYSGGLPTKNLLARLPDTKPTLSHSGITK
jgi:hypothetical protein